MIQSGKWSSKTPRAKFKAQTKPQPLFATGHARQGSLLREVDLWGLELPLSLELYPLSLARIPMGRPGQAEEVAALVAWLCSEECSFSTGAVFDISGGRATY
jgi:3-oxoacyl-[acyl-carrier protein] reductase